MIRPESPLVPRMSREDYRAAFLARHAPCTCGSPDEHHTGSCWAGRFAVVDGRAA